MDSRKVAGRWSKRRWLTRGVVAWGLPCGSATAIVLAVRDSAQLGFLRALSVYLLALPIFMAGGYVYGSLMWAFTRRRERKDRQAVE